MSLFAKSAAAVLALTLVTATVEAIPYASKITVSDTTIAAGTGLTISYLLNEDADSVDVEIVDGSSNVVATFAGGTDQGENQVVWNGTVDNASGANVAAGNYRVRITADKNNASWAEVASNRSLGVYGPATMLETIFNGWSPNDFLFVTDTDNDNFGMGLGFSVYRVPNHAAAIRFDADMSMAGEGDGFSDRIFIAPEVEAKEVVANFDVWGAAIDPDDPDIFYQTGQSGIATYRLLKGNINDPATMETADPLDIMTGTSPRSVVVTREGALKFAYFVYGNSTIGKVAMDPVTNTLTGPLNVITNFAITNRYGRFISVDDNGNLYFVSKHIASGNDGVLLRWDAEDIAGVSPVLTEANASWSVTYGTDMRHMMMVAITPQGGVYVELAQQDGVGLSGIYYVGNTSEDTVTKVLTVADRIVDYTTIGDGLVVSNIYSGLRSDPVGNLVAFDRSNEQVRLYAPPLNTSEAIVAPASQTFEIEGSNVENWNLY